MNLLFLIYYLGKYEYDCFNMLQEHDNNIFQECQWFFICSNSFMLQTLVYTLLMCPFMLLSPSNVLFLKEVTKYVHENQRAKSRAIFESLRSETSQKVYQKCCSEDPNITP